MKSVDSAKVTNPLRKALTEFQGWCDAKGIDPTTFLPAESDTTPSTPTSTPISPDYIDKLNKLADTLENNINTAKELNDVINQDLAGLNVDNKEQVLDTSQTFAQLYAKPHDQRSAIEQKLMDAVDANLSESDKSTAISSNIKVDAVIQQVNQSIARSLEQANQMLMDKKHKEKEEAKEKEQEQEKSQGKDDKMKSLGEEFGVADAIVKSIRERANDLSESLQKQPEKSRFEVVDAKKASSQDMPIDKANIAKKEIVQEPKVGG